MQGAYEGWRSSVALDFVSRCVCIKRGLGGKGMEIKSGEAGSVMKKVI